MGSDKLYRLSFATVCMNRLYHLKKTLPENIKNNEKYPNLEFIILDYNSKDDMEQWIKINFMDYIKDGRVVYYKNPYAHQFNMAHSKNMVSRLGSGDIICLIDADNYTGKGYAEYVNDSFNKNYNSFITTIGKRKISNVKDVLGRICFRKEDFLMIEGFDEFMNNYGFDDFDFASRLELIGRKRIVTNNKNFLGAISHTNDERIIYQNNYFNFKYLYISPIDPARGVLLFLFKDKTFDLGTVMENENLNASNYKSARLFRKYKYQFSIENNKWDKGTWKLREDKMILVFDNYKRWVFGLKGGTMQYQAKTFYKIENEADIKGYLLFHSEISNRNKMERNKRIKVLAVNNQAFGRGIVFKNFVDEVPIKLQ